MAFTNFRPNPNRNQISGPGYIKKLSLLKKACDLIKNFPEYYDVVVNVARKTDARHWADLFSAAGISTTYVSLSPCLAFVSLLFLVMLMKLGCLLYQTLEQLAVAQMANFTDLVCSFC